MAIEIITDSTSDLTAQEARERNVHLIPMRVIFEDGVYQDGVDLDKESFYAKQAEAKILPKTTQLNPQEYCDVFQPAAGYRKEVVAILLSSKLSGSYQSACVAAGMVEGAERLHLVDSLNVTIGEGLLSGRPCGCGMRARPPPRLWNIWSSWRPRVRFLAFVGTLKYLKMGGRVSASAAALGTMLGISPVVAIVDGEVRSVGKVRGKAKALDYTLDFAAAYPVDSRCPVVFGHSRCQEAMDEYARKVTAALGIHTYEWDELGAVIGAHAGRAAGAWPMWD